MLNLQKGLLAFLRGLLRDRSRHGRVSPAASAIPATISPDCVDIFRQNCPPQR